MGKKVNLNQKPSMNLQRKTHPQTNRIASNNQFQDTEQNNTSSSNEIQKEAARGLMKGAGVPSFVANSKIADRALDKVTAEGTIMMPQAKVIKLLIIIAPIVIFMVLISSIILIFDIFDTKSGSSGIASGGYYSSRCDEITVIDVDPNNDYEVTGTRTFSLEDYVAGVVYAEVGIFNNKEIFKLFSWAARTFVLRNADDSCSIENSARRQAFRDITDRSTSVANLIYEAVEETAGQVLLSNNELYTVQYDAFCSIDVDETYYTIMQQNQKIPVEWVDSQPGIAAAWKEGTCNGNHGRGMSQYGAYYLTTEHEYIAEELIEYYYGDSDVSISTTSYMTSIAGLDIKDTENATPLNQVLNEYLQSKGASIEDMNNFIESNVDDAGKGTREGVVTAAVSLINYLYDNFNAKLPYYWGGQYQQYGADPYFGTYRASTVSVGGNVYYYTSFDCSGFVSWAIKNGGYIFSRQTTYGFDALFSGDSCDLTNSNCVGQPGDLINSASAHVQLIVAVDEENGKYFIAESSNGVVMTQRPMHTEYNKGEKILRMDNFYTNQNNIDSSY